MIQTTDKCDSIGSDYCHTACRQCSELFSLDPDAADACDLCLLPFHSHCLKVIEHPLEDYTICLDCNPKAEARAAKANEASSDQVDANRSTIDPHAPVHDSIGSTQSQPHQRPKPQWRHAYHSKRVA